MRKLLFILTLILGTANAQTLDQSNIGGATNYEIIDNTAFMDQTFRAGITGMLNSVEIDVETFFCADLSNLMVTCEIWDSTGSILKATETDYVPVPFSRAFFTFNFSSAASLLANNSYTMRFVVSYQICDSLGPTAGALHWFHDLIDTNYANGSAYNNGSPINSDMYFKTYMTECVSPITVFPSVVAMETCGSSNGSLTCNPTGGGGTLSYTWSNLATTQTITNLTAGNYSITVTDGLGCSTSDNINLTNAGAPVFADDTVVAVTCFGACDGFVSVTPISGTPPYTYNWTSSDTTANINGLCAGVYDYTVTDINGCLFSNSLTVNSPNELTGSFIVTNESCIGNDGNIDLTPIGDFPPFVYSWTHGPATQDVSGLSAGAYSVTILDANGCTGILNENVFFEAGASIDTFLLDIQHNICSQSNGHISNLGTAVTTSNPPLVYMLDLQSISTAGAYNLVAGTYSLMATDAMGCTDTVSVTINDLGSSMTVGQGSTFTPTCPDVCNGTIQVGVNGGTAPYSYSWSNGYTVANGMNLCPGDYTVVVTDINGCVGSGIMTLNAPAPINIDFSVNNATCGASDGDALATVTSGGQAPFTFDWSNGDDTNFADSLAPGNYSVTMKDANACQVFRVVSVNTTSGPVVTENISHPSCSGLNNGAIDLTITGGTAPVVVEWSTGHSSVDLSSLEAGVYDVSISDASGCVINKTYQLNSPASIEMTPTIIPAGCTLSDGQITAIASGGTPAYSYQWSANAGSAVTSVVSNLSAGIYSLTITDMNGCSKYFEVGLSNDNAPAINVDQVIRPNCQTGGGAIFTTASGGTAPYSYLWNNGSESGDLENISSGIYSLTLTDDNNCIANASFNLPGINIFAQEICMITVDTTTNNNLVVWEKTEGVGIAEFRVYRETSVPNSYLRVATVPFDSLSQFQDTVASSDIHAWKYKLATVDSCGNESNFIASHKSIHLITSVNANWDVLLQWDDYIGFSYNKFYINRYHVATGWEIIDSVANTVHSYVDQNAPNGNVGYAITVPAPSDCFPTRAGVNTSRSNIRNQPMAAPQSVNEELELSLNIFPNPAQSEIFISLNEYHGETFTLEMYNAIGEIVFNGTITSSRQKIDIREIPSGAYFISLKGENKSLTKKVMIVK